MIGSEFLPHEDRGQLIDNGLGGVPRQVGHFRRIGEESVHQRLQVPRPSDRGPFPETNRAIGSIRKTFESSQGGKPER